VPWELVGIFVQISNYKISVIQFRSLAYKCLVKALTQMIWARVPDGFQQTTTSSDGLDPVGL